MKTESGNIEVNLTLNLEQWGGGSDAKAAAPIVLVEYLSGPIEFFRALRHVPRAIKAG